MEGHPDRGDDVDREWFQISLVLQAVLLGKPGDGAKPNDGKLSNSGSLGPDFSLRGTGRAVRAA
jgi:hypothetical protein